MGDYNMHDELLLDGDLGALGMLESSRQNKLAFYPNSHNTSPITLYPQQLVLQYFKDPELSERLLRVKCVESTVRMIKRIATKGGTTRGQVEIEIDAGPIYYRFFSETYQNNTTEDNSLSSKALTNLRMCVTAALECLMVEATGIVNSHSSLPEDIITHLREVKDSDHIIDQIKAAFLFREFLEEYRNKVQREAALQTGKEIEDVYKDLKLVSNDSITVVKCKKLGRKLYLLNYDQLTMLIDTIVSRSCVYLACLVNEHTVSSHMPTMSEIVDIYKWGDNLINLYSYDAYSVIGEYESLVTYCFISFPGSDPLGLSASYVAAIMETAQEVEMEFSISPTWVNSLLNLLTRLRSINKLSEVFGLRKHWGNPILNAKLSGRAVQDKAMEEYPINEEALLMNLASFQRMITLTYIKKEGKWPNSVIAAGYENTPLAKVHSSGSIKINESTTDHLFEHWAGVVFERNVIIDKCLNPLDLLSDKACSLYRQHVDWIYTKGLRTDNHTKNHYPSEFRRILLEYIRRNHYSIDDILTIVQTETIPDSWFVNLCALKGTEMKHLKGRIFAVLCYELRQYFAATEEIIKDHIFPYNPHQTMTLKEHELLPILEKVSAQLNPDSDSRVLYVLHIIDFSKWNLRMSDKNTSLVFRSIDSFIGRSNLIQATHHIFGRLLNIVQDSFDPPKEGVHKTESDTIWRFHKKGWEGQRQKGWTAMTSALLAYLEVLTGVFSKILGQGDNQVLCSEFTVPENYPNPRAWIEGDPGDVKSRLDNYYDTLVDECMKLGLPVKKSESCRSLFFCNYGKRLYFSGIELSMELKRVARIATESNDSFPTTDALSKTMAGATSAAPLFGPPSLTSVIVGHINTALLISRGIRVNPIAGTRVIDKLHAEHHDISSSVLRAIMLLPSSLGGPHRTNIVNSFYRGHPDPIAGEFATVVLAARSGNSYYKRLLHQLEEGSFISDRKDLSSVIKSPFSLNIETPPNPLSKLLKNVGRSLMSQCRNDELEPLFSEGFEDDGEEILQALATMSPFHPVIANEIYSKSLPGRRDTFVAGFQHTTSFAKILNVSTADIVHDLIEKEVNQINWWIETVLKIWGSPYDPNAVIEPHHVILQRLRCKSWGIEVEGVTVPHPLEAVSICRATASKCSSGCRPFLNEFVSLTLDDGETFRLPDATTNNRLFERVRCKSGYTGNIISEGMVCKTLTAINQSTALRDAIRLNALRRWITHEGSKLDKALRRIIKTRTNLSLCELNEMSGIPIRISFTHRTAVSLASKSCHSACVSNIHTQIYLSSNKMGKYSKDEVNYSFVYGQTFLMGEHFIGLGQFYAPHSNADRKIVYHAHVRGDTIPVVYDGGLEITSTLSGIKRRQISCSILYAPREDVLLESKGVDNAPLSWCNVSATSVPTARIAYGTQIIGDCFINEERLRSLIEATGMHISNPRTVPISVGDITGIGIKAFINTISNSLFLFLPWDITFKLARDEGDKMLFTFLIGLGSRPWKRLAKPFLTPNLLKLLTHSRPELRYENTGHSMKSLIAMLQNIVHQRIIQITRRLKQALVLRKEAPNIIIFADGKDSTRFLLSRYCEICLSIVSSVMYDPLPQLSVIKGRQMVSQIHKLADDLEGLGFEFYYSEVRRLFLKTQEDHYETSDYLVTLPRPTFLDLNRDWVSRIRGEKVSDEIKHGRKPYQDTLKSISLDVSGYFTYESSPVIINLFSTECDCPLVPHVFRLPLERLYMPSGVVSKDHYPLLEIIYSFSLCYEQVVTIGFESGTEAASLASLRDCKRVYTNPLLPLGLFDPHCAGSYVPPEFLGQKTEEKLYKAAEAILGHVGGRKLVSSREMVLQIGEIQWSGIMFRLRAQDYDSIDEMIIAIAVSLDLAGIILGEKGWFILEVNSVCSHLCETIISLIGVLFRTVRFILSSFTSMPGGKYFFCGTNPHKNFTARKASLKQIRCSILSHSDKERLESFFETIEEKGTPRIAKWVHSNPSMIGILKGLMPPGDTTAQHRYLPGWTLDYVNSPFAEVTESLRRYSMECTDLFSKVIDYNNRFYSSKPITGGMLMFTSSLPLHKQLEELNYQKVRANLLVSILSDEHVNRIDIIKAKIECALATESVIFVNGFQHVLSYSLGQFSHQYCGDLFEIIGQVLRVPPYALYKIKTTPNLHYQGAIKEVTKRDPLETMSITDVIPYRTNSRWLWLKRSQLLFILYVQSLNPRRRVVVLGSVPLHVLKLKDYYPSMLFAAQLDEHTMSLDANQDDFVYITLSTTDTLNVLDQNTNTPLISPLYGCLSRSETKNLITYNVVDTVVRPIWGGQLPGFCWVKLSSDGGYKEERNDSIDWSSTSYLWQTVAQSCVCKDCAGQTLILATSSMVDEAILDLICNTNGYPETVYDLIHPGQ